MPRKSKLVSSGSTKGSKIVRSKDIWFDDGNVVLQACNTQFRVHRSVLAKQSTVFCAMFTVPQPEDSQDEYVDGCPIVRLSGDTAEDWERFLSVLYRNTTLIQPERKDLDLKPFTSLAQLGKKYEFNVLCREARTILNNAFPQSLKSFDVLFPKLGAYSLSAYWVVQNIAQLVHLADELDIRNILPVVYYIALSSVFEDFYETSIFSRRELSINHFKALMRGRIGITKDILDTVFRWIYDSEAPGYVPTVNCEQINECTSNRNDILAHIFPLLSDVDLALASWESAIPYSDYSLCAHCQTAAMDSFNTGREDVWDKLPKYFFDSSWDELNSHSRAR